MVFENQEPQWFPTDSKNLQIGLTNAEMKEWHKPGFKVMEIGTGTNASTMKSLLEQEVDAIGIEPGMNYRGG